jgi:2-polyprenyl-3-methyl-5-hydroxy-6-metoxy-1,4-benzoquinol methylase
MGPRLQHPVGLRLARGITAKAPFDVVMPSDVLEHVAFADNFLKLVVRG